MKQKVIIYSARKYSMKQEDGRIIEGTSLRYFPVDSLSPVEGSEQFVGLLPCKGNDSLANFNKYRVVPGIYEADAMMTADKDGHQVIQLTNYNFVCDVYGEVKAGK